MDVGEALEQLTGDWVGTNRKRMMPTDPFAESDGRLTVGLTARGSFVTLTYTWVDEGIPQDGLLLIGSGSEPDTAVATWVDSWHQSPQWMVLTGTVDSGGTIRLAGVYSFSAGEEAGWQITIDPGGGNALRVTMDNVPPGEEPYPAMDTTYHRA